jgi:uncharacterized protein (TIGR03083 family)
MSTAVDPMSLARDERADLADLLATLTPAQWDGPTLCSRWTVREVVAHVFSYEELSTPALVGRFVRGGIATDRVNRIGVVAHADRSPDELLALARRHLRPRGLTAGFGGRIALTDGTIHHQDIRRPLGRPRDVPAERLREILDYAVFAPPIRAAPRIRGLRLVATDLDWSRGEGPEVTGAGESLLMAAAGRPEALAELDGPGQATLAARVRGS